MMGGAVEGIMMVASVFLTPFLLVAGFTGALIVIKYALVLLNYLFSLFSSTSLVPYKSNYGWIIFGVPSIILVYMTFVVTTIQYIATKFIAELPGEAMRHLHTAMTGHKAADQMGQRIEQGTQTAGGEAGKYASGKFRAEGGQFAGERLDRAQKQYEGRDQGAK